MAYSDFTLERARKELGLLVEFTDLFPGLAPLVVPIWLTETLQRYRELPLVSEKARGELIVMPVLVASRELSGKVFTIYSGPSLNVDASRGLAGECDFVLARTPPFPDLTAPLVTIVEAKRAEIEPAIGQCAAQMVGARLFNDKAGQPPQTIYGCVTTGEGWQFLKLTGPRLEIDRQRYYIDNLGAILAVIQAMIAAPP